MQNKIILIGGYCATGKSTFSRKLSQALNIPCFNKDVIKEVLGDSIGEDNVAAHLKLSAATFEVMLYTAQQFMQTGKPLILESNFKLAEGAQLEALIKEYNYQCMTFVFTADLDLIYKRYIERERHWIHTLIDPDIELFKNGNKKLGELKIGHKIIQVNTTKFEEVDFDELINEAKHFIS